VRGQAVIRSAIRDAPAGEAVDSKGFITVVGTDRRKVGQAVFRVKGQAVLKVRGQAVLSVRGQAVLRFRGG